MGIAKIAEVASHIVKPSLLSGIQSPLGTHTPEVVPFHVNTISLLKFTSYKFTILPYLACITFVFVYLCLIIT